jgi:hypothetical protein
MPRSSTFAPSDYNSALKHFHIASINRPPRQSLVPMNFDSIPELPRRTDGIEQQKISGKKTDTIVSIFLSKKALQRQIEGGLDESNVFKASRYTLEW